jgi:CDP-diacylglycerol--glycerol-3-phosphate 3-phosphatidyltransferase
VTIGPPGRSPGTGPVPVGPGGAPAARHGFGPTALATPANAVTVARLLATPVVVGMVAVSGPTWPALVVALAIGLTDGFDGWLARRQGPTRSGAFMDPLADKVIVLGLLAVVAARGEVSWAPVAVIAARELGMSVYRSVMGRRGVSIPARPLAKLKTLVQGLAAAACLVPPLAASHAALDVGLWVAAAFTVVSGVQYLVDGRQAAAGGSS